MPKFKYNIFTGNMDVISLGNFSYDNIVSVFTVPENQQMIVYQNIAISADVSLLGDLVLID